MKTMTNAEKLIANNLNFVARKITGGRVDCTECFKITGLQPLCKFMQTRTCLVAWKKWLEMETKDNGLKPCPFCGHNEIDIHQVLLEPARLGIKTYKVCCWKCAAQIFRGKKEEAIEAWNRRANNGK